MKRQLEMNEDNGFFGWVMGGIATIIAALTTAVATLYKAQIGDLKMQLEKSYQQTVASNADHHSEISRLDMIEAELRKEIAACKTDREDLRVCLARQQVELEMIKHRVTEVEKLA